MRFKKWWIKGRIIRGLVTAKGETHVAMLTLFRVLSVAVTVTELGGVHVSLSVRLLVFEAALGLALWEKGVL